LATRRKIRRGYILFELAVYPQSSTPVKLRASEMPTDFILEQNYPNPFNPRTAIQYHLARSQKVRITIYNVHAQKVIKLVDTIESRGVHRVVFDGSELSAGLYFCHMQAGATHRIIKMSLVK
jgi:hypothetical protein